MPRHVAFLRAINVGGRNVKMQALVALFEGLGFTQVSTFIASGNVIFSSTSSSVKKLTQQIEAELLRELGYEVATFLRTPEQVAAAARATPFPQPAMAQAQAFNIGFLAQALSATQAARLQTLRSPVDEFVSVGSEVFWLCRVRQSDSKFSNAVMERALGLSASFRSINTVQRLAESLASP